VFNNIKDQLDNPMVLQIMAYSEYEESLERAVKRAQAYRENTAQYVYGWIEDGVVLGVCAFHIQPDKMIINGMAVAEHSRKNGIGRAMVTELQMKYSSLEAETDDDAVGFYRKCGFIVSELPKVHDNCRWRCVLSLPQPQPQPQSWQRCDIVIHKYVTEFVDLLRSKLLDNLTGIYLHGSLAMNSYFPPKSDLDFIIVVDNNLGAESAKDLNQSIARYAETRPTMGSIECSVITCETAKNVSGDMPYELHYSETWHQRILDDQVTYDPTYTDPDLPAHLMCVKRRGICLYGQPIDMVFSDVDWDNFIRAVLDDFDWIIDDNNICESPYYGVLNICRTLQILTERNQKYLSKYEGAMWGITNLPKEYTPLIRQALLIYCSNAKIPENERKTGGDVWNKAALFAFRDYARKVRCVQAG